MEMQKIKKFKFEIAQISQNKANFPSFFLLTFSSGGIPSPQIPRFLLSSRGHLSIFATTLHYPFFFDDLQRNF